MKASELIGVKLILTENGVANKPNGYTEVFMTKVLEKTWILFIKKENAKILYHNKSYIDLRDKGLLIAIERPDGLYDIYPIITGAKLAGHWCACGYVNDQSLYLAYTEKTTGKDSAVEKTYCAMLGSENVDIPESDVVSLWT